MFICMYSVALFVRNFFYYIVDRTVFTVRNMFRHTVFTVRNMFCDTVFTVRNMFRHTVFTVRNMFCDTVFTVRNMFCHTVFTVHDTVLTKNDLVSLLFSQRDAMF